MSSNIQIQRICQHCGKEFTAKTTITLYCSHRCNSAAYKVKQRADKVEKSNNETLRIKNRPLEELKSKVFLSIADTCKLIGISRRTVYRMIERGELIIGKAGRRTIIKRSDLDQLFFEKSRFHLPLPESKPELKQFQISECYTTEQIRSKYRISESGLRGLIIKHNIPKFRKGWYAYLPKTIIDNLLS